MITLEEVKADIIQSNGPIPDHDFAAVVVKIDEDGVATHAGILINYNGSRYVLHYTSVEVKFAAVPNEWYFHKTLSLINPEFIGSFYVYCSAIVHNASPEYGYVYGGSLYDENGVFFSLDSVPEIMTCVGFCINVIHGFLEAEVYFQFTDWDMHSLGEDAQTFIERYINEFSTIYSPEEMEALIKNIRRITPCEFLTSAFIERELPIRKAAIDTIISYVTSALESKISA